MSIVELPIPGQERVLADIQQELEEFLTSRPFTLTREQICEAISEGRNIYKGDVALALSRLDLTVDVHGRLSLL